jgi:hypothetical protein
MTSHYPKKIILVIEQNGGEIHGTCNLAAALGASDNLTRLKQPVQLLVDAGAITVTRTRGGRGHQTVYKRNRNSTGQARRRRNAKSE